jgi:predicted RNA-binding protein YlxR (DUF448 family)
MTITSQKKRPSTKHVAQRTCVGCRAVKTKRELIRIVRTGTDSARVDPTGKAPGRGVYICTSKNCWDNALRKESLDRALRMKVSLEDRRELAEFGDTLAC